MATTARTLKMDDEEEAEMKVEVKPSVIPATPGADIVEEEAVESEEEEEESGSDDGSDPSDDEEGEGEEEEEEEEEESSKPPKSTEEVAADDYDPRPEDKPWVPQNKKNGDRGAFKRVFILKKPDSLVLAMDAICAALATNQWRYTSKGIRIYNNRFITVPVDGTKMRIWAKTSGPGVKVPRTQIIMMVTSKTGDETEEEDVQKDASISPEQHDAQLENMRKVTAALLPYATKASQSQDLSLVLKKRKREGDVEELVKDPKEKHRQRLAKLRKWVDTHLEKANEHACKVKDYEVQISSLLGLLGESASEAA
jgi:hypothetical protein